ncbi:MAG: DMT family transporter [Alphaproteobacteria bacterium]|nr:DMT family transporter [Alphaproteobacteria bacterium]
MSRGLRKGPLLMAGAALVFTVMVGLVKVARSELTAMEIVLWRSVVGVPLALAALRGARPRIRAPRLLAVRVVLGFGAMICFFTAAKGLSVAEHSLVTKVQPLLMGFIAPLALGRAERAGGATWGALALGMVGCAVLLAPELDAGAHGQLDLDRLQWGLWALGAASLSACAHTSLRALGSTDEPAHVVFWFQLGIVPLALALQWVVDGHPPAPPPPDLWLLVAGIGACAVLGQTLMTRAYQADRAAVVAAAAYTAPLWAVIGDVLFFDLLPAWTTVLGGALIVAAGLWVSLRRDPVPAATASS